jgi:hypothetical protein
LQCRSLPPRFQRQHRALVFQEFWMPFCRSGNRHQELANHQLMLTRGPQPAAGASLSPGHLSKVSKAASSLQSRRSWWHFCRLRILYLARSFIGAMPSCRVHRIEHGCLHHFAPRLPQSRYIHQFAHARFSSKKPKTKKKPTPLPSNPIQIPEPLARL